MRAPQFAFDRQDPVVLIRRANAPGLVLVVAAQKWKAAVDGLAAGEFDISGE